jgi:hypothetical protein
MLTRLSIILPGTKLEASWAFVRSLPATLLEIDVECHNAETFLIAPVDPLAPPSLRTCSGRASIDEYNWGFVNVNMGQRFPNLNKLRLMGTSSIMWIVPPNDVPDVRINPLLTPQEPRFSPGSSTEPETKWTHEMAYNFLLELPSQLQSFHCQWLLHHAIVSVMTSVFEEMLIPWERLPLPRSLTEISGRGYLPSPILDPLAISPTPFDDADATTQTFWQQQSLIHLTPAFRAPFGNYWPDDECWPPCLTSLHLDCPLPKEGNYITLPKTLKSFVGTSAFETSGIQPGWFPQTMTKLSLTQPVPWSDKCFVASLPPSLLYLKIALAGFPDLSKLPRSLRTLEIAMSSQKFGSLHVKDLPPQLHTFALESISAPRKMDFREFPPHLTCLRLHNGEVIEVARSFPRLLSLKMLNSDILEEQLPRLPPKLQQLQVRSVLLDGSSLKRFPSSDSVLTAAKWNVMLDSTLPRALKPFWGFKASVEGERRVGLDNLAMVRTSPFQILYLPPQITEIDLRAMANPSPLIETIPEEVILQSIAAQQCKIASLRLPSISLSSRFYYPPSLTELASSCSAVEMPPLFRGFYSGPPAPAVLGPVLFKLVVPARTLDPSTLPSQLTYLDVGEVDPPDLRHLEVLQTLFLRESKGAEMKRKPLFLPLSLTHLVWPAHKGRSELASTVAELPLLENLEFLKSSFLRIPWPSLPGNLTYLNVDTIKGVPQEVVTQALQRDGQNLENFDLASVSKLIMFYWLPNLKFCQLWQPIHWAEEFSDLELVPEAVTTLEIDLKASLLTDCENPASVPKKLVKPIVQPLMSRWTHLTSLIVTSPELPHYATRWIPRSVTNLTINNKLFTTGSYRDLPSGLFQLKLLAVIRFRPAFAAALPDSLRLLSLPSLPSTSLAHLPRNLRMLKVEHKIGKLSQNMHQLPPTLTSLHATDFIWPYP